MKSLVYYRGEGIPLLERGVRILRDVLKNPEARYIFEELVVFLNENVVDGDELLYLYLWDCIRCMSAVSGVDFFTEVPRPVDVFYSILTLSGLYEYVMLSCMDFKDIHTICRLVKLEALHCYV